MQAVGKFSKIHEEIRRLQSPIFHKIDEIERSASLAATLLLVSKEPSGRVGVGVYR